MAASVVPVPPPSAPAGDGGHRLAVFATTFVLAGTLLALGITWPEVVTVTAAAMAGSVEIARRLTVPPAPTIRVIVIVIVCVIIAFLLQQGYPPVLTTTVVLGAALFAGEVARRFAGATYRLPKFVF